MNILMNLYPVQSGGGQQVAVNFIRLIARNNYSHSWFFYVGENSEIHDLLKDLFDPAAILALPYSYAGRVFNRRRLASYMRNNCIDIVYNYAPALSVSDLPQVVRSVYSNLYYPDVDFWAGYPIHERIKRRIIDFFRLRGTLIADGLVFENEGMQKQAELLYQYDSGNTIYIAPSVTEFDAGQIDSKYDYLTKVKEFKVLYLSSWHLNKNIHKLPDAALKLKNAGVKVKFVLSLDPDDSRVRVNLTNCIHDKDVSSFFEFIGKVEARFVHQVLRNVDAVILLSKLECFSSNVIEAYTFDKPLIISDEEWSRAACKNAALYVDRDDPQSIANGVSKLMDDQSFYLSCIAQGRKRLSEFNKPDDKVRRQVEFLEYIYGRCGK